MTDTSLQRWLLINYAGYPYSSNSLMADNGLANLAGVLLDLGREVEILDYATVHSIRRMTSPDLQKKLTQAWNTFQRPSKGLAAMVRNLSMVPFLKRCERHRRLLQEKAVHDIETEIIRRIAERHIDAVGFKLWNGDGLEGTARLAAAVRRHYPRIKIFGGGPHVDVFMERLQGYCSSFDAFVYGEGEETIRRLAEEGSTPGAYHKISNLIFEENGVVHRTDESVVENLDSLPMPVYDPAIYPAMAGDEKVKIIVIDESRGCRNCCAFCIHPVKSHRHMRIKGIPRLLTEVQRLKDLYGFQSFRFAGSCTPYSLLNTFAAEILRRNLSVRYASFAHIRDSHEADFDLIKKSGCASLFFGVESGSQDILNAMNKRITVEQIHDTLQRARASGIFTVGSFIFPAPGENSKTEQETRALLRQQRLNSVLIQAPVIAPRTPWFDRPEHYGIAFDNKARYLDIAMTWKVKLALPPRFWDPLPVRVDGRSYKQVLAKTWEMYQDIKGLGIPIGLTDEHYLMSRLARMGVEEFRDITQAAFYTGNADTIAELVRRINHTQPE